MEKLYYTWSQAIGYLAEICSLPQYDEYEYWLALCMSRREDIVGAIQELRLEKFECEREIDFVVLRDWIGECLDIIHLNPRLSFPAAHSLYTLYSVFDAIAHRTLGVTDEESFNQLNKPF